MSYDFDLLFERRLKSARTESPLSWVMAPSQAAVGGGGGGGGGGGSGFTACLWLRVSATETKGTVISLLSGSQRTMTSHDDRYDVIVMADTQQVAVKPECLDFLFDFF